jgi:hypothetical protein
MAASRRKGGKPREPKEGERFPISFRVPAELKRRLDEASQRSGRSQSQEAELRLWLSFREEGRSSALLESVYGPRLGALLDLLGRAMEHAGTATAYGERRTDLLLDWTDDKEAARQAVLAARTVLEEIGGNAPLPDTAESNGVGCAWMVLAAVGASATSRNPTVWAKAVEEAKEYFREAARGEDHHG